MKEKFSHVEVKWWCIWNRVNLKSKVDGGQGQDNVIETELFSVKGKNDYKEIMCSILS